MPSAPVFRGREGESARIRSSGRNGRRVSALRYPGEPAALALVYIPTMKTHALTLISLAFLVSGCAATDAAPPVGGGVPESYASLPLVTVKHKAPGIEGPIAISRVEPVVSDAFRRSRDFAEATAEAVVDEEGRVVTSYPVEGDAQWGQSIAQALAKWRFQPATRNGDPIMVRFQLTATFRTSRAPGDW